MKCPLLHRLSAKSAVKRDRDRVPSSEINDVAVAQIVSALFWSLACVVR
jgi:hypothetical protein